MIIACIGLSTIAAEIAITKLKPGDQIISKPFNDNFDAVTNVITRLEAQLEEIRKVRADSLPRGTIVAWATQSGSVPEGWVTCDGLNGTPNLHGRFLRGAVTPTEIGPSDDKDASAITGLVSGFVQGDDPPEGNTVGEGPSGRKAPGLNHTHQVPLPPHYKVIFIMKR